MNEFESNIEVIKNINQFIEAEDINSLATYLDRQPDLLHKQFYRTGQYGMLAYAASLGNLELCQFLLDRGIDVNQASGTSGTPLHMAVNEGRLPSVKWLLAHGANVDGRPENITTPLMNAITSGHVDIAKYLMDHGADINRLHSRSNQTPLDIATKWGQTEIEGQLRSRGALQTSNEPDWSKEYGGSILKYINDEFGRVLPIQLTSIIASSNVSQRLAIVNKGKNKLLFTLGLFAVHRPMLELFVVLSSEWNLHDTSASNQFPSELLLKMSDAVIKGMHIEEGQMILQDDMDYTDLAWPADIAGFQVADCSWGARHTEEEQIAVEDTVNLWTLVPIKRTKDGMAKYTLEKNRSASWSKLTLEPSEL